jgi:hypothetical protein
MIKVGVALYVVNALISIATGARYLSRTDFLPYQAKAVGHGTASPTSNPGCES